jgi:hypothetical protein
MSFTIAVGHRQHSNSRVQVQRELLPHFTVSDSRLPQPGGPGPRIYIPQEQGGPIIPPGIGFPFRCLLRLAGLRWRYSTPPPHGYWFLIYDWTTYSYIVSRRIHRKHIRCPAVDIWEPYRRYLFICCCICSVLHSKGSHPIVACVFVAAGMCLPTRCPATDIYVTIYLVSSRVGTAKPSRVLWSSGTLVNSVFSILYHGTWLKDWFEHMLLLLSLLGGVRTTKITGSSSDDWIYWRFG